MKNSRMNALDRVSSFRQRLSDSLWFVPSAIVLASLLLALALVDLSSALDARLLVRYPRIFGASAESSRSMLSTIAGSMVTTAGVTFSVMVLAVSQASTQYTPRVMRNFMRDRLSQVTLGALIGVFVYCLIVLRTVRSGDELFIPSVAVAAAVLLALVAVALLMYFIHHIASTLEAGEILGSVAKETLHFADRQFAEELRDEEPAESLDSSPRWTAAQWQGIPSSRSGYIQHLDVDGLTQTADRWNAVVRMERAVGEFVAQGTAIASIVGCPVSDDIVSGVNDQYVIDTYRTVFQDPSFGIRQMVDIAIKALSPGVNDSTTAVTAVDYLAAVLVRIASRQIPPNERLVRGEVRLIMRQPTFNEMLDEAFSEIRRNASNNPRVLLSILGALELVARAAKSPGRRKAVAGQLDKLFETFEQLPGIRTDSDLAKTHCERVRGLLSSSESSCQEGDVEVAPYAFKPPV